MYHPEMGILASDWEIYGYDVITFADQSAGLVLELTKKLAANLSHEIDPEVCIQIRNKTYGEDRSGGRRRDQVKRFPGKYWTGNYDGTIARIPGFVSFEGHGGERRS